jgi:hypothetical protein
MRSDELILAGIDVNLQGNNCCVGIRDRCEALHERANRHFAVDRDRAGGFDSADEMFENRFAHGYQPTFCRSPDEWCDIYVSARRSGFRPKRAVVMWTSVSAPRPP